MATEKEIKKALKKHRRWLDGRKGGVQFALKDLLEANLTGVDLYGSDLEKANLSGARLVGAELWRAHLLEAVLCNVDLRRADLRYADIRGVDFSNTELRGVDFRGAVKGNNLFLGVEHPTSKWELYDNLYKYQCGWFIDVKGIEYIKLGCYTRELSEWEGDFWVDEEEFPAGSYDSQCRILAYETMKKYLELNRRK